MKKILVNILSSMAIAIASLAPLAVAAGETDVPPSKLEVCEGISVVSNSGTCDDGDGVKNVIARGIAILSWIVGIVATVVIIIAGVTLVTAQGDSGALSKAKNTILYAGIGLALAIFSGTIVSYVVSQSTADPGTGTASPSITRGD